MHRLLMRFRRDGVLSIQVLKAALASALAYEIGTLTSSKYPVFAALAGLLVVQVTVFDSVSRGLQRVAGVVVGVLTAFGFARLVGLHAWSLGVVVLIALALGRALRLGDAGAVQVPVSALLVVTVGTTGTYAVDRITETLIGAAVGICVNVAIVPPTRTRDAGRAVGDLAAKLAAVLRSAGEGLQHDTWRDEAEDWLTQSRGMRPDVTAAAAAVDHAETSLRLNPRGARLVPAARRRRVALRALERADVQIRGVMRTLLDAAEHPDPGQPRRGPARRAAGHALTGAGDALAAYAVVAAEPAAHDSSPEVTALREALAAARVRLSEAARAAQQVPTWSDTGWLIYGAMLTDVGRILDELDGRAQAELVAARISPTRKRRR